MPDGKVYWGMQPNSLLESRLTERMESLMETPEIYHEALRNAERGEGPQVIEFQVRGYYNQLGQFVPVKTADPYAPLPSVQYGEPVDRTRSR